MPVHKKIGRGIKKAFKKVKDKFKKKKPPTIPIIGPPAGIAKPLRLGPTRERAKLLPKKKTPDGRPGPTRERAAGRDTPRGSGSSFRSVNEPTPTPPKTVSSATNLASSLRDVGTTIAGGLDKAFDSGPARTIGLTNPLDILRRRDTRTLDTFTPEEIKIKARELALSMLPGGGLVAGSIKSIPGIVGGKVTARQAGILAARGIYAPNKKTARLTSQYLLKIGQQMKKPYFVVAAIGTMIGSYGLAWWARVDNALVGANIAARDAIETGDPELIKEVMLIRNEIFELTVWEKVAIGLPIVSWIQPFSDATKAAMLQKKVSDHLLQDEVIALETGETDDEKWERIRQEERDQTKKEAILRSEESRRLKIFQIQADEAARNARNASDRRIRNQDALFWANERAKERLLEEKERKRIAEFWIAYRKTAQEFRLDNTPSRLGFGLL